MLIKEGKLDSLSVKNDKKKIFFEAAVNAFSGSVYICSSENVIEYANEKALDEIGRDVTGEYCYSALYGHEGICPWCKGQGVLKGKIVRCEFENPQTGQWFHYEASPIFHSDGTVSKLILSSDITKTKLAEKELKESKRRLQTLMANLPGMVFRCKADTERTMEFASKGSYKLMGYHPSDLIGKGVNAYKNGVDPRDRESLLRCVDTALNEKRSYSFIYRVKKVSGETIWVWEQGEGVFSSEGELVALEGFITDITQHKKAELDLRKENIKLNFLSNDRYKFGNIVGKSPEMQKVYELIMKAASNDVNVIISGESGTGKELVAQSIHRLSDRKTNPFVTVNSGAINENLMESEFFGYKKNSFTGAVADCPGYLDQANGGTLFLDELGEMSKSMQVLLLRAIELKEYTPVGGNESKKSDFRIIAATHRNLKKSVKNKKMREDFYYRIHILSIHLPPLRKRKEDISLLIDHFIEKYPAGKKLKKPKISADVRETFQRYNWPGNVRELQNAVQRYLALGQMDFDNKNINEKPDISKKLTDLNNGHVASIEGLNETMIQLEKKVIRQVLEHYCWNRGKTAQFLKIDRKTLYRKIKAYDLVADKKLINSPSGFYGT
jgi:PAS domain S-box-containing protein